MKSFQKIIITSIFLFSILFFTFAHTSLTTFIRTFRTLIRSFSDTHTIENLMQENASLRFTLQNLQREKNIVIKNNLIPVLVYSRYPFNDQNLFVIAGGSEQGIVENMPVFVREGILLGKIVRVRKTQSEVQTIFDPEWRSSVVVGSSDIKAVLKGGNPPYLDLIAKDAPITSGNVVYNISPEFPLNNILGEVEKIISTTHTFWQNATLRVAYRPDNLYEVFVMRFPE